MKSLFKNICIPLLLLAGAGISLFLLFHHVKLTSGCQFLPSSCAINEQFNCDVVALSSYSQILGMPVAGYGLFFYLFCFLLTMKPYFQLQRREEQSKGALFSLSVFAVLVSLVFFHISHFVIRTFCLYCSILYLINVLFLISCFVLRPKNVSVINYFASGFRDIFSFLVPLKKAKRGEIFWLVLVLSLLLLMCYASRLLLPFVCSEKMQNELQEVIDQWKSAPVIDLPINISSDPKTIDYSLGRSDAPVTIVVFSDFQCPYCRIAAQISKSILNAYPNSVRLIYKNFPLDAHCNSIITHGHHQYACRAAYYARCAGQRGEDYFWRMHDQIFSFNQLNEESFQELPLMIGMSEEFFEECSVDPQIQQRVLEDIKFGQDLKLPGTPAMYINGKYLSKPSLGAVKRIVDLELMKK